MTSPAPVTIRPARAEDQSAIAALAAELALLGDHPPGTGNLALVLAHRDHAVYVAAEDDAIRGWIHAFIAYRVQSPAFVEIGGLAVSPARRGGGIGSRLIDRILAWARQKGVTEVRVRAREERHEAVALYARRGFVPIKKQLVLRNTTDTA